MNIGGLFLGACCAVATSFITVHFFLNPEPEFYTFAPAHGMVRLEGYAYEDTGLSFSEEQTLSSFPLTSTRYHILPYEAVFSSPLQLSFLQESSPSALYLWKSDRAYWIPVHEASVDGRLSFSLVQGGIYAPGERISIESPTFLDVLSELRAKLPEHTVFYDTSLIATPKDGVPVLIASHLERGGCGGAPFSYEQALVAQESRTVHVLVNDVFTETTFTLFMDIGTTTGGCPEDMPLQLIF